MENSLASTASIPPQNIHDLTVKSKRPYVLKINERVYETIDLINQGFDRNAFFKMSMQTWGITKPTAQHYWDRAIKRIQRAYDRGKQSALAQAASRRNLLYKKAVESDQIDVALDVEKDLSKLQGLYPSEKVEHSGSIGLIAVPSVKSDNEWNEKAIDASVIDGNQTPEVISNSESK